MKKYKSVLKSLGYFSLSILIYLLVITTFAHFNLFSYKTVSVISFIFMCLLFMISGFNLGRKSEKRGYVTGAFIGGVNILFILILSLILRSFPGTKNLLYFSILLLSSTLGGMFGINKKRN